MYLTNKLPAGTPCIIVVATIAIFFSLEIQPSVIYLFTSSRLKIWECFKIVKLMMKAVKDKVEDACFMHSGDIQAIRIMHKQGKLGLS